MCCRTAITGAVLALALSVAHQVSGEAFERLEPIVLTASPAGCPSPAATATPVTQIAWADRMCALPSCTEMPPCIPTVSQRVPLPADSTWRGYGLDGTTVYALPAQATALPSCQPVQVLRPVTEPSVPSGYVVGRNVLGQPKLYKPGQPVRNLLRYITW